MTTEECGRGVVDFEVERKIEDVLKLNEKKAEEYSGKDEISDDGSYELVGIGGGDGTESDEVVVEVDHVGEGSGGDVKVVKNAGVHDHDPSVDIASLEEGVDERSENSSCGEEERDRVEVAKIDSEVVVDSNKEGEGKGEVDDAADVVVVKCGKELDDGDVMVEMPESDAATVEVKETSELHDEEGCRKLVTASVIETTATGIVGSGSSVSIDSDGVMPNSGDLSLDPHFPGEETERGNASEEHCETVSTHSSNDCVESDSERKDRSHSDDENLKNQSAAAAAEMENVENGEDGSKEVALEDYVENVSVHGIQADSVEDEKDLDCEAATPKSVEDGENIAFVDVEKMDLENSNKDISCSLEEIESTFETTHALIEQWGRDGDVVVVVDDDDKVDAASTNTETLESSSPGHKEEQKPVDIQAVKTEINQDSDAEQSEIVNREGRSIIGVTPNEILPSESEDAVSSSFPGQTVDSEPKWAYCYMIKIPRFFDDNLMAQKEDLELQVDEKTKSRDSIKYVVHSQKTARDEYSKKLDAARKEEKAARDLFNTKRQEIDAIQNTINMMKNASSVDEIDDKINKLEHRIQHETIPLKEEKHLIREIKTLKQNRDRISSTLGPQAEVREAYDQKNLIEKQYENLKQELNSLRGEMFRVEMNTKSIKKKYDDECQALRDLYAQRDAANNLRQQTYSNLWNIKKEYHEKNVHFYRYKDDRRAADNYVSSGEKHSLKHLCTDQVEKYMELWNRNDEFRNHYVKFNMSSTVRRFKTLDSRSLGPDEAPTVLPNIRDNSRLKIVSLPSSINDSPMVSSESITLEKVDLHIMKTVTMQKSQTDNPQKSLKVIPPLDDVPNVTTSSGESVTKVAENKYKKTEDDEMTRKANEVARQEEELQKEKAASKLKEKIRLEQIAKAKEATERKKRQAEKAKARAELKAQREAELKEKKKAKKDSQKEKKLAGATDTELSLPETAKDAEAIKVTTSKRPAKALTAATVAKQNSKLKHLPLPLRNRGKRKMQAWMLVVLIAVLILVLFLMGNYISLSWFINLLPNSES